MADAIDIKVPDLGDFEDVEIIEILVSGGDEVKKEDGLITLETDKAAMDVPAPEDGTIEEITVEAGDRVSAGDVIGRMVPAGGRAENGEADEHADEEDAAADGEGGDEAGEGGDEEQTQGEPPGAGEETDSPAGGGTETVAVPDIGDFEDVDVIEVHVAEGDEIKVDDPVVTLETDKAAMDVPSTVAGTVEKVSVSVDDKVSEGDELITVATAGGSTPPAGKPTGKPDEDERGSGPERKTDESRREDAAGRRQGDERPRGTEQPPKTLPPINEAGFSQAHASPSVRKLARELGVDLTRVKGTGPKKRILHEDVKAFVKRILSGGTQAPGAALPQVPTVDYAKFGDVEAVGLTRIQKIAGPRLQASWVNLPHVTQHDLADITELEAKRQELKDAARDRGIRLTPLAFILKACIASLKAFPKVNASLSADGESLVYKKYVHLGFAADTDQGLVVPVIRDADTKDVYELATELADLSEAAREGKLKADQMQGASFTISSLGGIGGTAFTPIVNAPEVAILGVSRSSMQPVWDGQSFVPRLMLPLSFSYDHRVIDGAYAVRFTTHLSERLGDVDKLLEAIP